MQFPAPVQANWREYKEIRACCFFPCKGNSKASNCSRCCSRSIPGGLVSFPTLFPTLRRTLSPSQLTTRLLLTTSRGSISTHSSVASGSRLLQYSEDADRLRAFVPVSKSTTIRRITRILFLPSIRCLPCCSRLLTVLQFRPGSWFLGCRGSQSN